MTERGRYLLALVLLLGQISPHTGIAGVMMPPHLRPAGYRTEVAFGGLVFHKPVAIVTAPGDPKRLFIAEKWGRIMVIRDVAKPEASLFLDLSDRVPHDNTQSDLGLNPGYLATKLHSPSPFQLAD